MVIEKVERYCGKLINSCRRRPQIEIAPHLI